MGTNRTKAEVRAKRAKTRRHEQSRKERLAAVKKMFRARGLQVRAQ